MYKPTNLLVETIGFLEDHYKTINDVKCVILGNAVLDNWEITFARTYYSNDYGEAEIPGTLMVVGDNWWLERVEYDGAEWWEFKQYPIIPTTHIKLDRF